MSHDLFYGSESAISFFLFLSNAHWEQRKLLLKCQQCASSGPDPRLNAQWRPVHPWPQDTLAAVDSEAQHRKAPAGTRRSLPARRAPRGCSKESACTSIVWQTAEAWRSACYTCRFPGSQRTCRHLFSRRRLPSECMGERETCSRCKNRQSIPMLGKGTEAAARPIKRTREVGSDSIYQGRALQRQLWKAQPTTNAASTRVSCKVATFCTKWCLPSATSCHGDVSVSTFFKQSEWCALRTVARCANQLRCLSLALLEGGARVFSVTHAHALCQATLCALLLAQQQCFNQSPILASGSFVFFESGSIRSIGCLLLFLCTRLSSPHRERTRLLESLLHVP